MNHFKRFSGQLSALTFFAIFLPGAAALGCYFFALEIFTTSSWFALGSASILFLLLTVIASSYLTKVSIDPIEKVWQAVWHVSPGKSDAPAPKVDSLRYGRELVSAMVMQIYDFASTNASLPGTPTPVSSGDGSLLIEHLPLAVFVLDKDSNITVANASARSYLGLPAEKIIGQYVYNVLHMSFRTEDTLEKWLSEVKDTRATDTRSWEHVRAVVEEKKEVKQFELAASFSKDDSSGNEVIVAMFDRTEHYDREEEASSYVAMAVHELRTPLTVLRGYIEVFEDELGPSLSAEYQDFMHKMSANAQSLSAFVSNILNVARVDENQMTLQLHEADWNEVLASIVKDLELRAKVRGKVIETEMAPELPSVGIDRVSMYEVVSNLVDNAIKYSGQSQKIIIRSRKTPEGMVETEVEDFGPGMPTSVVQQLFTKFYRSHRSRGAVGGSGLGLYLVKSIISAHGGGVWVQSKEGQGSKFGFTLRPFASINQEASGPDGIERQASGWIKNHSMYRR